MRLTYAVETDVVDATKSPRNRHLIGEKNHEPMSVQPETSLFSRAVGYLRQQISYSDIRCTPADQSVTVSDGSQSSAFGTAAAARVLRNRTEGAVYRFRGGVPRGRTEIFDFRDDGNRRLSNHL